MKTLFKHFWLFAAMVAGCGNVWGEILTIAITARSIKDGGGALGSNSYSDGAERTWTQDGVSFGGKAITEGNGSNAGAIQAQASNGVLYNTTPLPGKIVSIKTASTGAARSSSCYGGAARLVNSTAADYGVNDKGAQVGAASDTGWTAEDFSGTAYTFFAIKRGAATVYWDSVVIICEVPDPSVTFSPSVLAFGTKLVGTPDTMKLNVKGIRLTSDVTLSIGTDTAGVFSIPEATVTAAEAVSKSGKNVAVVFTPAHTYSYGGELRISSSSADFADTTLALTGTGGVPTVSADSAQLRFGRLVHGDSVARSIKISSHLLADSISVSFADNASGFFRVSATKLAPNRSNVTLTVSYAPTDTGEHAATLRLQSGSQAVCDVPLSGSAVSLLLEENFEYEAGAKLTDNGWAVHSAGENPILVASGLTFGGYDASGRGGAAAVVNTGEDVNRKFGCAAATAGKIYMAFMFTADSANSAGYFMHFAQVGSAGAVSATSCSRLFVDSKGERIGVSESGTAPASGGAWLTIAPKAAHLGVVEFDFDSKTSKLYVFGTFPAAQPSSGYVTSAAPASISNVGAVVLRQYSANQRVVVDGIRVATTWEEAVKVTPVPPTFAERPAVEMSSLTALSASVKMKATAYAAPTTLYYAVKTAPVASITAADILSDFDVDSATVSAAGNTVSLGGLTIATTYYAYFVAKNRYGFSEVDSAVFTTPSPTLTFSPSVLAFGTKLVGTPDTMKLNIKGINVVNDITVSVGTDTAGVFSIPEATVTAAEAVSKSGRNVYVVFTPKYARAYGGKLRISSPDFADTALALTGTGGVPTVSADSAQLRFGRLVQGDSVARSIKISSHLLTDSISVSFADNASGFFRTAAVRLAPNRSNVAIAVSYAPTDTGAHTATLRLQSGSQAVCDVPLSGGAVTLLLEENFEYEAGAKLTDNGWAVHSAGENPILVASGLTFGGYDASGRGGAAAVVNTGEDVNRKFGCAAATAGKIYMAFMFTADSANSAGYFMHFAQVGSAGAVSATSCSRLFVDSKGERIGVSESGTAPAPDGAWLTITPKAAHLGVVEFDFDSKTSKLYVFGTFPAARPSSGYVTSAAPASISNVGAVVLRQHSANQRVVVDGIRVATTWEEAVKVTPVPPTFAERPAVEMSSLTALSASVKMKATAYAAPTTLYYAVKTAPVASITAADILSDFDVDSATVSAAGNTVSLGGLTIATTYYAYFVAKNRYGFSEVDSAVFTTPSTMLANPGFEGWTGGVPDAWTISGSVVMDTLMVKEGKYSAKVTASGRVDVKQTVYGVEAGKHYTISFWYYIDTLGTNGIRLWANFSNGATLIESDTILRPSGYLKVTKRWTQFVIEDYVAPAGADNFNFEVRVMSGNVAYFDDFCFDSAPPIVRVSPTGLLFSAIAGRQDSLSVQVTAINFSENLTVSISGAGAGYFYAPATLPNDSTQTLTITYAPDAGGNHLATLTVAGGGDSCRVELNGTSIVDVHPATVTPISSICTGAGASPYQGQRATIAGIVTAVTGSNNFFVQSGSGARSGIYARRRGNLVSVGDSVLVTGWINEYSKLTEITISNDADVVVASSGNALPPPTVITIDRMSKAYHGVLLSIAGVEVSAHATDTAKYVVGGGGGALVVARELAVTRPAAGAIVNITGIGFCNNVHQLLPRSASDVAIVQDAPQATAVPAHEELGVAIYPNPADDLLYVKSASSVAKIEVYTLVGTMVLRKEFANSVSIANLKSGIYIAKVLFANGASLAKIITKK